VNAAISGTKGFALIVDGEAVDVIDLDGRRGSAQATHVRRMLDEAGDARFIECRDLADVQWQLKKAANAADALQLTLIALDSLLSRETRHAACMELAELFKLESVVEYVERVIYARPLGLEHDLPGARVLASASVVGEFMNRLHAVQVASTRVCDAWERIIESKFATVSRRDTFACFVQLGVVRDVVKAVALGIVPKSGSLPGLKNPRVASILHFEEVVDEWFTLLKGLLSSENTLWQNLATEIRRYLSYRIHIGADREDLLQDIMMKLIIISRDRPDIINISKLRYSIMYRSLSDYYRRQSRASSFAKDAPTLNGLEDEALSRGVHLAPYLRELKDFMEKELTFNEMTALELVYIHELNHNSAAEILGISPRTLHSLISEARKKIIAHLGVVTSTFR
jgi:RNA polymerase sigma factor (sigma-70 family)